MRTVLLTAASTAVCAFLAAAPAFAQDTVSGAPAGQAPVTVEGYGYLQGQTGQPGIGNDYPAYYYGPGYASGPWGGSVIFAPIGALAWGMNTAGAIVTAPFNGFGYAAPARAPRTVVVARPRCDVWADFNGRRTAYCGP